MTILGRAKRFAKIGGEMIPMQYVEEKISELLTDKKVCVLNLPDSRKGEVLVVLSESEDLTREAIHAHFKDLKLPEIYAPKIVFVVDAIPLLGTGKTDFGAANEMARNLYDKNDY